MSSTPLISVIVPVFNGERYIQECIESILLQTHENWELIIVNDGSTDSTEEVVKKITDHRIKYLKQDNTGVSGAKNFGISEMHGDYFCFLDGDDILPEDSLQLRLDGFYDQIDVVAVGGARHEVSTDLRTTLVKSNPTYVADITYELAKLNPQAFYGGCVSYLFKTDTEIPKFKLGWTHCEDMAFLWEYSGKGRFSHIDELIYIYRRHTSSAMSNMNGLVQGYYNYYGFINKTNYLNLMDTIILKYRIFKVTILSLLSHKKLKLSIIWAFKILFK